MTENSVKPSQIKNLPWVYVIENPNTITIDKINSDEYIHDNFENIVSYKFINDKCVIILKDNNKYGKFMLWYDKNIIDQKWKLATDLFHSNKLKNIVTMKCSTSMNNPNTYNENESVILLYCVDYDKKELREIAKNIINLFDYRHKSIISYKTNVQTRKGGKYKPYSIKNHLYKKCKSCKKILLYDVDIYHSKCEECMFDEGELDCVICGSTVGKMGYDELLVEEGLAPYDYKNENELIWETKNKRCIGCKKYAHRGLYLRDIYTQSMKSTKYREDCPFCGITNCNCGSGY